MNKRQLLKKKKPWLWQKRSKPKHSEAQHKLFARKNFRERFQRNALQLFAAPEELLIGRSRPAEAGWVAALAASGLLADPAGTGAAPAAPPSGRPVQDPVRRTTSGSV